MGLVRKDITSLNDLNYMHLKGTMPYYKIIRRLAFPSMARILMSLFAVTSLVVSASFYIVEMSGQALLQGLFFGLSVFSFPALFVDALVSRTLLKNDPLFYLRRCYALSLFSCTVWCLIFIAGAVLADINQDFLFPEFAVYFGLFMVLPFRMLSIHSMSQSATVARFLAVVLQPAASVAVATALLGLPLLETLTVFAISSLTAYASVLLLLRYVESKGVEKIGASPLRIFRAFLIDWLDGRNAPLEEQLDKLGILQKIDVNVVAFRRKKDRKLKGVMVASNFHPGPFLNIGSSVLPYLLKDGIENETAAYACVPHGVSGHELNLVSQQENKIVLEKTLSLLKDLDSSSSASKMIRVQHGCAKATCQAFGKNAIVTLTISPLDMEDIPYKTGSTILTEARKYFHDTILIDAHNSLTKLTQLQDYQLEDLVESAKRVLAASHLSERQEFLVGVAKHPLKDFSLRQGIGPGGLTVFLVKIGDQLSSYIIIDGNNMKSGVRESILNAIKAEGITDGEVMTTDTHAVNGIVPAKLGYHPVGEALDVDLLISRIREAVAEAKHDLELCEFGVNSGQVMVKTIGPESLGKLTEFTHGISKIVALSLTAMFVLSAITFPFFFL